MSEQRCKNCLFWERDEKTIDGYIGLCHRFPPQLSSLNREYNKLVDARRTPNTEWPETYESDWCGEWKAADQTKTEDASQDQELLNRHIVTLNFPVRVYRSLRLEDAFFKQISTLGELISNTPENLLDRKNFGMTGLGYVRKALAALGLKLKGD